MTVARLLRAADIEADVDLPEIDVDEVGTAAEVARLVRRVWGMQRGPVPNVVEAIERAGVVVIPCDFGLPKVDAIGMRHPQLPPLIFANTESPPDRLRYTLAHELGHLVMHDITSDTMEDEANLFAAEFLMPEEDIKPQLKNLSLPVLATLKRIWRVSMAALLRRAHELGVISLRAYQSLQKLLSMYGYRKREPVNLDPPREEPTLLNGLIDFHRTSLKYGKEQIAKALNLFPNRFSELYESPANRLQLVG
jgi:Zn-dependent peptidase ImmA (M78 family)